MYRLREDRQTWIHPGVYTLMALVLAAVMTVGMGAVTPAAAQGGCGTSVRVVRGDTLNEIAARCDTTVQAILNANPTIVNPNLIFVGQIIQIPQGNGNNGNGDPVGQPSVRVVPDSAVPGATVDVFATGFPANSNITFGIGPQGQSINTARVVTNEQGAAETTLTVPAGARAGQRLEVIAFVPVPNGPSATTSLTVRATPVNGVDVTLRPTSGPAGTPVTVRATGLPANRTIQIGAGRVASEYDLLAEAQSSAQGTLVHTIEIPTWSEPGEEWVIALTPVGSPADYVSNRFRVTQAEDDNQDRFTRTQIYLIALEDDGASGIAVGCGDSAVPVTVEIEPTLAVMTAAMRHLVNLDERYYGQSGLYNALYESDLTVEDVTLYNGHATIRLSGTLSVGGVCDVPRIEAQLRRTALQYSTVDSVSIFVNGVPLAEAVQ